MLEITGAIYKKCVGMLKLTDRYIQFVPAIKRGKAETVTIPVVNILTVGFHKPILKGGTVRITTAGGVYDFGLGGLHQKDKYAQVQAWYAGLE